MFLAAGTRVCSGLYVWHHHLILNVLFGGHWNIETQLLCLSDSITVFDLKHAALVGLVEGTLEVLVDASFSELPLDAVNNTFNSIDVFVKEVSLL